MHFYVKSPTRTTSFHKCFPHCWTDCADETGWDLQKNGGKGTPEIFNVYKFKPIWAFVVDSIGESVVILDMCPSKYDV